MAPCDSPLCLQVLLRLHKPSAYEMVIPFPSEDDDRDGDGDGDGGGGGGGGGLSVPGGKSDSKRSKSAYAMCEWEIPYEQIELVRKATGIATP